MIHELSTKGRVLHCKSAMYYPYSLVVLLLILTELLPDYLSHLSSPRIQLFTACCVEHSKTSSTVLQHGKNSS